MAAEMERLEVQESSRQAVHTIDGNWLGAQTTRIKEETPAILQQEINLSAAEPQNLEQIAARITWKTGIPVRIDPDLGPAQSATQELEDLGPRPPRLAPISYRHTGSMEKFLNAITAQLGIVWSYEDQQIHLSHLASKVFTVHLLPGTAQSEAAVGGQAESRIDLAQDPNAASGGSGGSGSSEVRQTTDVTSTLDRWGEIIDAVTSLLSLSGRMSASPSIGAILVTDTPAVLRRVERFINQMNAQLIRQIAISVHIFSVTNEQDAQAGLNWRLLFDNEQFRTRLLSPPTGNDIGSLSLGLVETLEGGARPSSDFAGTTAIIKALNSQSNVTTITSANLITLNNQPAPVQVTRSTGYLRSISNVVTGTSGVSETTLEPGRVTSGFVMTITPRVLEQDRILLRFAADLSSLLGFSSQSSSGASIQTPETDERAFLQEVIMRSGQSLVLSGFEQMSNEREQSGIARARNWLAGANDLSRTRTRILIVISPTLIGDHNGSA